MSRAKEIAAAIINDVWTSTHVGGFVDDLIRPAIEAAVEKHMLRPHQVKDRDGDTWEQMSNGLFSPVTVGGEKYEHDDIFSLEKYYGPLTTIHGEPMPDAGEVERLKARIVELEKLSMKTEIDHDEIMNAAMAESGRQRKRTDELAELCGKQRERIAELENYLNAARSHIDSMEEDNETTSAANINTISQQAERIAELEKQLAEAKAEPAKPQPSA